MEPTVEDVDRQFQFDEQCVRLMDPTLYEDGLVTTMWECYRAGGNQSVSRPLVINFTVLGRRYQTALWTGGRGLRPFMESFYAGHIPLDELVHGKASLEEIPAGGGASADSSASPSPETKKKLCVLYKGEKKGYNEHEEVWRANYKVVAFDVVRHILRIVRVHQALVLPYSVARREELEKIKERGYWRNILLYACHSIVHARVLGTSLPLSDPVLDDIAKATPLPSPTAGEAAREGYLA